MTIGQRVQAARREKGLTQKELATKLGLATGSIQQYELGKRQPRLEQLQAIAAALGVSISYLTGEPVKLDISMPNYPLRMPTKEEIDRMAPAEQEYYYLRLLADTAPDSLRKKLTGSYEKLNKLGQVEAVRRIQELSKLSEYTEPDPNNRD